MFDLKSCKQYDNFAIEYSNVFLEYNMESINAYFHYFNGDFENLKILDMGCGTGHDIEIMSQKKAIMSGFDASTEMVRIAKEKNPDSTIKLGRFEEIPFSDNSFDIVMSKWAIQTTFEIDPVYKEVARVLKKGGYFIYLACHPIRQFMEKKIKGRDYFKKELVESVFFGGQITAIEPSHTFNEYFSQFFFSHFSLDAYEEGFDSAAEIVEENIYPGFFIVKARLK